MDKLSPELLAHILEESVADTSFETFVARSAALRSLTLVNRQFRKEANRLLLQFPVLLRPRHSRFFLKAQIEDFEQNMKREGRHVQELRLGCRFGSKVRTTMLQNTAVVGLSSLSLWSVSFEPNILLELKNLRALSLSEVSFKGTTSTVPLPSLEDFSMWYTLGDVPPCLLLPQLPALRALAHQYCGKSTRTALDYILSHPRDHLRLLSIEMDDPDLSLSKEEITSLADIILVDMDPSDWVYSGAIDSEEAYQSMRMCAWESNQLLGEGEYDTWWDMFWGSVLPQRCPKMKVIVIPSSWIAMSNERWRALEDYRRAHKVEVLVEQGWDEQPEGRDSLLSKAYLKHLSLRKEQ